MYSICGENSMNDAGIRTITSPRQIQHTKAKTISFGKILKIKILRGF